jgi:hypothetical protein
LLSHRGDRGPHCRARSEAIIDQDHRLSAEIKGRALAAELLLTAAELLLFPSDNLVKLCLVETEGADHRLVKHAHATAGDRAHGKFLLTWDAQLPDDEDIERKIQRAGHLIGDRNAPAR